MDLAPRVGALAGVLLFALVAAPYAVADGSEVATYYDVGPVGPPLLVAFDGVAVVALLSGAAGRADPPTVAGVALAVSGFVSLLALWWSAAAGGVVGGMASVSAAFGYHRWAFVIAALLVALAAAAYARSVLGGASGPPTPRE